MPLSIHSKLLDGAFGEEGVDLSSNSFRVQLWNCTYSFNSCAGKHPAYSSKKQEQDRLYFSQEMAYRYV
jgi:hypothetical protein